MKQDTYRTAREIGPTCTSVFCLKSKLRGCGRIDENTRRDIHKYFWKNLNDWNQRKIYTKSLVMRKTTNRKTKNSEDSRRSETLNYYLTQNNSEEKIQVCRLMFLNTLSLKATAVQQWVKQSEFDTSVNDEPTPNPNNLNCKKINAKNFLTSLAKMPSHYARKETNKLYLEPTFQTVTEVFKAYKEYCSQKNFAAVSRFTFDQIFTGLNLSLL